MSFFRKEQAPFGADIWGVLEAEVATVLGQKLTGRKIADFVGPAGEGFASVNTGELEKTEGKLGKLQPTKRKALPVLELKTEFTLPYETIEALKRGATVWDAVPVHEACKTLADAENALVFDGFAAEGVEGIRNTAPKSVKVADAAKLPSAVAEGIGALLEQNVEGPFALILGPKMYAGAVAAGEGYPVTKKLEEMLGGTGRVLVSPGFDKEALLVSLRGGDFEILSGMDVDIGFGKENAKGVELFLFETLTFRLVTPEAAVVLKM